MWSAWFFVIVVFILSALWSLRIGGLWKLPNGRDWLWGKLGLFLNGGAMLSKSLVQFSVDGRGCVPSLLLDLRPNGGGNEDNGDLLQKVPCMHCCTLCPWPCSRPLAIHASTGDSWTHTGMSGSVSMVSLLLSPGSWCEQSFDVPSNSLFTQSCVSSVIESHWPPKSNSLVVLSPFTRSPRLGNLLWALELS